MTWITLGLEHKALEAMNSLELWMIRPTLGHVLKALDGMSSSGVVDDMNDFGLWAKGSIRYEQLKGMDEWFRVMSLG